MDPERARYGVLCRCGRVVEATSPAAGADVNPRRDAAAVVRGRAATRGAATSGGSARVRFAREAHVRRRGARRWLGRLCWLYLAGAVLSAIVLWGLSDAWWPATILLFSGRWILLAPVAVLLPAAALFRRRSLPAVLAAAAVIIGPVVGLRVGWAGLVSDDGDHARVRAVTLNAAGLPSLGDELPALLSDWRPDIVALQECGESLRAAVAAAAGWNAHVHGSLCLLSRYPILSAEPMDRTVLEWVEDAGMGGSGVVVRYRVAHPASVLRVANLHLETPRKGFTRPFDGGRNLSGNTLIREVESGLARRWADEGEGPLLVLGDFNTPVESRIYRRAWGDLGNAFSQAGRGFGMTKHNGWIRVRIDHILFGDSWRAASARVAEDVGSDHRPLIADLVLLRGGRVAGTDAAGGAAAPRTGASP